MTEMTKGVLRVFVTLMLAFGLVAGAASVAAQTEGGAGGDGATGGTWPPIPAMTPRPVRRSM
jgi:hypothetical protein